MKILLLSGGFVDEEFAAGFLKKHCFDKIIAVDGVWKRLSGWLRRL